MTAQLLLAFVLFAFATAGTPGPNNMMLLASGANFGVRRTAAISRASPRGWASWC